MIIRSEQLDAFTGFLDKAFQERVAAYLRRNLPEHTAGLDDEELYKRVDVWRARAARFGVTTQRAIAKWCFLAMVTSETFDEEPKLHEYLTDATPDPTTKINTLMDALYIRVRQSEITGGK